MFKLPQVCSRLDTQTFQVTFGDTVSDVATEPILDVTKVLSIIKLCI